MNAQTETGLAVSVIEKSQDAEAKARRASEQAKEAAIKAKESAGKSAQTTKKLFLEAKRKARAAQIAALIAKREAKRVARMVKEVKLAEKRVTDRSEIMSKEKMNGEDTENGITTSIVEKAKQLSNELLEGRINILLQNPNAQHMYSLERVLHSVQNISVISVTGSTDGNCCIAIQVEQPVPLIDILGRIPVVEEVTQIDWKEIQLSLKK